MNRLRLLLVIVLFVGGGVLVWHVPWQAVTDVGGATLVAPMDSSAPWWSPPANPSVKVFKGQISEYLDSAAISIEVRIDQSRFFLRFAGLVVGSLFLFGLIGRMMSRKPVATDIAYSLSLSFGFLLGTLASALAARVTESAVPLPWISYFWAGGVVLMLVLTVLARRDLATP